MELFKTFEGTIRRTEVITWSPSTTSGNCLTRSSCKPRCPTSTPTPKIYSSSSGSRGRQRRGSKPNLLFFDRSTWPNPGRTTETQTTRCATASLVNCIQELYCIITFAFIPAYPCGIPHPPHITALPVAHSHTFSSPAVYYNNPDQLIILSVQRVQTRAPGYSFAIIQGHKIFAIALIMRWKL